MSKYTSNSPLLKIQMAAMMLFIIALSIWFALASQPVAMKRESDIIRYAPGNPAYEVMKRESEPGRSILVNFPNGRTLVWEVA